MMFGRGIVNWVGQFCALLLLAFTAAPARAEDGYALWLRYAPLTPAQVTAANSHVGLVTVRADHDSPTIKVALEELSRALPAMLGPRPEPMGPGMLMGLTERLDGEAARLAAPLAGKASGAYRLALLSDGRSLVAANDEIGLLYGTFALLRRLQATGSLEGLDELSAPVMPLRMLNHWDNPDGTIERGYAGRSIFDWWRLPGHLDQRMIDYARANASLGINGTVVNNVNAKADMLNARYIARLKRLADAFRPYGIRVYLSARFSAPRDLGGLATADPLDPAVRAWWKAKADEIYADIPDFGGFLVKANSEGQPGPQDYGRNHADGANMLAEAIGNRGTVIWRAFVYQSGAETDRAKLAFEEFQPLDGKFAANVIVQIKNGPIDFQPREPFHPLFGAMPKTRLMLEAQITKEYLGQSTHLVYLAPMWAEALGADTGHGGKRPLTVAQTVTGGGMAGVANIGSDRNWSGSHFDQANWYAFGRMAWNPALDSEAIAREWAAQTFSRDPAFIAQIAPLMMRSRQAAVDCMTPLGLTHQMATGHHYGPGPWISDLARPEWNPAYYSRADRNGIGFDRTKSGSDALGQYAPSAARQWRDAKSIDDAYLLWFHHVSWDTKLKSGRTVWQELVARYDFGVSEVDTMATSWARLSSYVDAERFRDTAEYLAIQQSEARWWRDASIAYFADVSGRPLPAGVRPPAHDLVWYKAQSFPEAPGN